MRRCACSTAAGKPTRTPVRTNNGSSLDHAASNARHSSGAFATPLAFSLLIVRTLQNLWRDLGDFRAGRPFNLQVSIFGD
jgi:hypothetical protein